jgi:hypothetical protein
MSGWTVLTQEEEQAFDYALCEMFRDRKAEFLEKCQSADTPAATGTVRLDTFYTIIEDMRLAINEKLLNYVELLFYTD